jgi:hypothetical protein
MFKRKCLNIFDGIVPLKTDKSKYTKVTGNIILNWNCFIGYCLD